MHVHLASARCPHRSEDRSPGTACELSYWCWELILDPLQEQVLLMAEPSSHISICSFVWMSEIHLTSLNKDDR